MDPMGPKGKLTFSTHKRPPAKPCDASPSEPWRHIAPRLHGWSGRFPGIWVFPKIGVFPPKWMVYNGKTLFFNGWFGCFRKLCVFPPNHPLKNRVFHCKPSILGETPLFFGSTPICQKVILYSDQLAGIHGPGLSRCRNPIENGGYPSQLC